MRMEKENPNDFFESVDAFVAYSEGDHAIKKILIANNGIGATKAIKSIRQWSFATFGDERMIKFVVMATPEDMRANAEYIRMADEVVDVPGGTNNNNYANVNLICQIAENCRVDAVMPMWGHASENPSLPTRLLKLKRRVSFVGPSAAPMQALGDKIGSTIIAQSAGVPTIAWNGDNIKVDYRKDGIPDSVYAQANVPNAEEALACCERIGYPVMIKASEGGGGKGIRKVKRTEEVLTSFRQVQGEIPGSPIFVMKMASNARHLEVQLLADKYGEAIPLSGRDCSVQRRHQKIIEEGPPTAAPAHVFKRMEKAACALAKTVGYCNAGTVEYLYLEATEEFAFLELNPRLQVEHPVTENILGLNLPACQIQVAMGVPLHRIADVRILYGRHPKGRDTIDFDFAERCAPPKHCIAVRVTAENPENAFQPTSGRIKELHFHSSIDVWGYFSVNNSGLIHEFADSQFGHIFAGGRDRESARRAMVVALKGLQIRGEIHTTIEYIIKLLQSEDFVQNRISTDWLDGRIANHKELAAIENALHCPKAELIAMCGAALRGYQHFQHRDTEFVKMLSLGQVPTKDVLSPSVSIDLIYQNIKYCTSCLQSGVEKVVVQCNGASQSISIRPLADEGYLLKIGNDSHLAYCKEENGGNLRMVLDGTTCMFTPEYDPTKLVSEVAGKLARLLVADGTHVEAGDPFVEIEVMKMYMPLKVLEPGTVHFQMSEGAALSAGDVIATVHLDHPENVITAEEFKGSLVQNVSSGEIEQIGVDQSSTLAPHLRLAVVKNDLEKVLEGYPQSEEAIKTALDELLDCLNNPLLPALSTEEALSTLRGRIDSELATTISNLNDSYRDSLVAAQPSQMKYPAASMLIALQKYAQALPADQRVAFSSQTAQLWATIEPFVFPTEEIILSLLSNFLAAYLEVEQIFDNLSFTDVVNKLRKDFSGDLQKVLQICRSHVNIKAKNSLLCHVIEVIRTFPNYGTSKRPEIPMGLVIRTDIKTRKIKLRLTELARLHESIYSHVSFSANLLLIDQFNMTADNRRQRLDEAVVAALTTGEAIGQSGRVTAMRKFIESNTVFQDILIDSLRHDSDYQISVMELYLRKIYQKTHDLMNFSCGNTLEEFGFSSSAWVTFEFKTKLVEAVICESVSAKKDLSYTDLAGLSRQTFPLSPSSTDLVGMEQMRNPVVPGKRNGIFATLNSFEDLPHLFPLAIKKLSPPEEGQVGPVNAVHFVILAGSNASSHDDISVRLSDFLRTYKPLLEGQRVRRVTFIVGTSEEETKTNPSTTPTIFTFRSRTGFLEDRLFRHIEAPHAFHLDLPRLANFRITLDEGIQTSSGNLHLYRAVPVTGKAPARFFARLVSFTADVYSSEVETLFVEALDNFALAIGREETRSTRSPSVGRSPRANHIFMNIVSPDTVIQPEVYENFLRDINNKYSDKMRRLGITIVELKLTCRLAADKEPLFMRFVASNPTGFVLKLSKYYEAYKEGRTVFKGLSAEGKDEWDGLDTQTPYAVSQEFEMQRAAAMASSETLYAYDWPVLFESAVEKLWTVLQQRKTIEKSAALDVPSSMFVCQELVLCDRVSHEPLAKGWTAADAGDALLLPMTRSAGLNDVGMVAWLMNFKTPEFPRGREVVVICNDITFQAGSFGTKEDQIFFKASEFARARGIPRLFLAANSGARIGMAQSLKGKFQICWSDESDPSKGFKYIFLTEEDYQLLLDKAAGDEGALPVICTPVVGPNGETRHRITDIIGEEPDLGVENLMGSGLIAGETSRAYDEIFTLTLVVGRTVGIGAYLVRLGQRTVQKTRSAPIILTGYQALNKLMGREIYTTNDQLGGPMIMFPNGVSHQLAETHMDSVTQALEWLSFIPAKKGGALPVLDITGLDSVERQVQFAPQKGLPYDPRLLFCGIKLTKEESSWKSGFFDRDSFVEALTGWAKTVVVGRGRLGGIPLGVIVTENRTAEATKPADPADATSQERLVQQAGGVWFPDSAYKTAQALRDFDREGLPCIIFANWRGFSGGQRDMFDEVLKFGSMIVDALVAYKQPLFVYIPPFAELRGGAWVVVDSTINADVMEFYAAEDARGGVLEAAGAASIKFRDRDILQTAHRTDHVLMALDQQLENATESDMESIKAKIKQRERMIYGVYQQVAVHFADLHDTPGRMLRKGVIRRQVPWAESRTFFYWRLRRRLLEFSLADQLIQSSSTSYKPAVTPGDAGSRKQVLEDLEQWLVEVAGVRPSVLVDDRAATQWYDAHQEKLQQYVASVKSSESVQLIKGSLASIAAVVQSGGDSELLRSAIQQLSPEERNVLLSALK